VPANINTTNTTTKGNTGNGMINHNADEPKVGHDMDLTIPVSLPKKRAGQPNHASPKRPRGRPPKNKNNAIAPVSPVLADTHETRHSPRRKRKTDDATTTTSTQPDPTNGGKITLEEAKLLKDVQDRRDNGEIIDVRLMGRARKILRQRGPMAGPLETKQKQKGEIPYHTKISLCHFCVLHNS
jgi:hypothetical protein